MKRLFQFIALLLFPAVSWAQFTHVTATVPQLVNASYIVDFIGLNTTPGAGPYLLGGLSVFPQQLTGQFTSNGVMSLSVADNNQVLPLPSQWRFNICVQASVGPTPLCFNVQLTITGASQDISSQITAALPVIPTPGGAVFAFPGIGYNTSSSTQTIATPLQIQTQASIGVHTSGYLASGGTFLYSPVACVTAYSGPTCVDATPGLQAAQSAAALTGSLITVDAPPPGYVIMFTQLQAFNGEGGIVCGGRHYEQGCPWFQIPGTNKDGIVPNPGLPPQGYLDYYLIDGMAFYGDFTYTSTTGNCINFAPLRVAERTEVNRTTCNSWPNNGFAILGGSDPLYFTDTEASGNGYGSGGGFGWNFDNTGGNTFDMVTLEGWSADNNVSGAINVQNTSNYGCVTCADTFIFRSGKMESRYDNIHYPDGQPVGINLNNTSGTPVIIDGLSAISVDPAGAPITTVVRNGSGTMVITTPTPHPPAHVGSLIAMNGNSQSVFNLPAVFTVTASTQTTTTVSMSGGALTGTGGNMFYKVVTDELVNITGNSANVKLNGVTMAGGQDAFLGPFGWYNIINDQVNGFTNNITSVPNHSTANGGSWTSASYTYPNFCADGLCLANNSTLNAAAYCNSVGTLDQSCIENAAVIASTTGQTIFVPKGTYTGTNSYLNQSNIHLQLDPAANLNYALVLQGAGFYRSNTVSVSGSVSSGVSTFSGNFTAYSPGQIVVVEQVTNNGTVPVDFLVVNTASGTTLTTTTATRFSYSNPNISIISDTVKYTGTTLAGVQSIPGNYTADFVAGDVVRIENTTGLDGPGNSTAYFEIARVASINGSAVTFETALHMAYTNPWLAKMAVASNISVSGGTINELVINNSRQVSVSDLTTGLSINQYLYDFKYSNLRGVANSTSAFFFTFMYNGTFNNIVAYGSTSSTDNGNIKSLAVSGAAYSGISTWGGTDLSQGQYPFMFDFNYTPYTVWNSGDTVSSVSVGSSNGVGGSSIFIAGMRNSIISSLKNYGNMNFVTNEFLTINGLDTNGQVNLSSGGPYTISNFAADSMAIGSITSVSNSIFDHFIIAGGATENGGAAINVLGGSNNRFLHGEFTQSNLSTYTINAQATSNNMYYEDLQDYSGTNLIFSLHTNTTGSHTLVGNRFASNIQGPLNTLNVPVITINTLGGTGHALACLDASGNVYRGTSTTCP